jgi:adenine-specific DNA-methyltransferase
MKNKVDKGYLDLFIACRNYVCSQLDWTTDDLNRKLYKIIKTNDLIKFYEVLQREEKIITDAIECEADFFHQIDHYDEYILSHKRDVTGSYYTPTPIVNYMCQALIDSDFIKEKMKGEGVFSLLEPACGTMTFLRGLILTMKEKGMEDEAILGIVHQMVAVDIQAEPLILGTLGMIYVSHKCLGQAGDWSVYYGDTLKMQSLHQCVDVVFGNPPYLGEKGNGPFFRALKEAEETGLYYEARMDLYYFFIHFGLNALKEKGLISFITTNYFTTADSGSKLRERLQTTGVFRRLTDYSGDGFFKSARGQHNVSFVYEKRSKLESPTWDKCQIDNVVQDKKGVLSQLSTREIEEHKLYDAKGQISLSVNDAVYDLLEKVQSMCDGNLSDHFDVKQGIVSGGDAVTNRILKMGENSGIESVVSGQMQKGDPIFVFPYRDDKPFEGPWQLFYKNSDIGAYYVNTAPRYMIYYVDENWCPTEKGLAHLQNYEFMLSQRREVKLGYRHWYELQWPRSKDLFEQPKIVMPQRSKRNVFAFTDKAFYGSADIYYIVHESQDVKSLLYLTGILNSKLYYFWLYHRGKKKGDLLELYSTPIKNLPLIHYAGLGWQNRIIDQVKMAIKSQTRKNLGIDYNIYEGFSLKESEIELIETLYRS